MKNLILIFILISLLLSFPAFAEIVKENEGKKNFSISSIVKSDIKPWDEIKLFNTNGKDGLVITSIIFFISESGLWFFDEKDMDINIDGENFKAKFLATKNSMDTKQHKETRMAAYQFDQKLKEKIKTANRLH
ncbi:MAG: hypothetical protein HXY52_01460 [Nitrospirae bacterium]|jgi:uncharacterized protein YneR|nr:hypothetical protein [Nitrospirota bacterium]